MNIVGDIQFEAIHCSVLDNNNSQMQFHSLMLKISYISTNSLKVTVTLKYVRIKLSHLHHPSTCASWCCRCHSTSTNLSTFVHEAYLLRLQLIATCHGYTLSSTSSHLFNAII